MTNHTSTPRVRVRPKVPSIKKTLREKIKLKSPSLREVKALRNPLADLAKLQNKHQVTAIQLEKVANGLSRTRQAYVTENARDYQFQYLLKHLIAKDALKRNEDIPSEADAQAHFMESRIEEYVEKVKSGLSCLQKVGFWVEFLHQTALTGQGRLTSESMAHVNNRGNRSYTGSQYTAPCQVDEETMAVLKNLQSPGGNRAPLSLQSLKYMFNAIRRKLHLDFNLYLDAGLVTAVEKIIGYHVTRLEWYPTGNLEKLWITDSHVNEVLAAVWSGWQSDKKAGEWTLTRLCLHTAIQMLDVLAIRQTSFIDHSERPKGVEGRYLRWGHLRIRLVGYDNNQPEFVVVGTASGTKAQAPAGDKLFADITILSRKPDDKVSSARDLALGIVLLAVVQGAMGSLLYDVIKCRSVGDSLLSSSPDDYYEFACRAAYQNSPVFIKMASPTDGGLKHPLDVAPAGFNYRPLSTDTLRRQLGKLGNAVGFEKVLNYSVFRRSWCYKALLYANLTEAEIKQSMTHSSKTNRLHRFVYQPTRRPVDMMDVWFGDSSSSSSSKQATSRLGSLYKRPDPTLFEPDKMEELRKLMEDYDRKEVTDEMIIATYSEINSGHRVPLKEAVIGILRFIDGDDWSQTVTLPHPFVAQCQNQPSTIVEFVQRL